ncbi:PREDICTED: uncharacterized protein LOC105566267 [Vollenhovia emeryi]|uniref:uncharacterized protein LOC105566267 n=1 Tax=Vollenhovia emeryi TaxID=411798 RepID=UPI0005F3970B|nr:PREDICTED: uncharacterized protein LOC105566267 [Vollenhovia emeryi]
MSSQPPVDTCAVALLRKGEFASFNPLQFYSDKNRDFHVKLPRQSSRSCHVIFPTVEEKMKNYQLARNQRDNDKRIVIRPLSDVVFRRESKTKKKIYMPEIKLDVQVTETVFVSNIANGTKSHQVKSVLPGCARVTLLKPYNKDFRSAIAKMENTEIAAEYLREKHKWPIFKGHRVCMKADTRAKRKKKQSIVKFNDNATKESNES